MARNNGPSTQTPIRTSLVYREDLSDMLFRDRQSMQSDLCHIPNIFLTFALK